MAEMVKDGNKRVGTKKASYPMIYICNLQATALVAIAAERILDVLAELLDIVDPVTLLLVVIAAEGVADLVEEVGGVVDPIALLSAEEIFDVLSSLLSALYKVLKVSLLKALSIAFAILTAVLTVSTLVRACCDCVS